MAGHVPVMAAEVVSIFAESPGGIFLDATFGSGGHTREIERSYPGKFRFMGIDRDSEILSRAGGDLPSNIELLNMSFAEIPSMLEERNPGPVTGALFDLGLNSEQIDEMSRGFSFRGSASLDMRFDRKSGSPLWAEIRKLDSDRLVWILKEYGQERNARSIARKIISAPPSTTDELAEIVKSAVGPGRFAKSAARVFQAFRIYINSELAEIQRALSGIIPLLASGGRLAVISYHSLEDGIVKRLFQLNSGKCFCGKGVGICECGKGNNLKVISKKPLRPSDDEIRRNSRSRPARLRYAERI